MKRIPRAGFVLLLAAAAACGPDMTEVRKYVARSPHRTVALFPLDYRGAQPNAAKIAGSILEGKLRQDGFRVADKNKTAAVFAAAALKQGAFASVRQAAELAKAAGAQAALIGSLDEAYERLDRRPAQYGWVLLAPPACCYKPQPCANSPVYDPSVDHYVGRCAGTHRKVLTAQAVNDRYAGATLRLRLVDAAGGAVLWESVYGATIHHSSLPQTVDAVAEVLNEELVDAAMKRGL